MIGRQRIGAALIGHILEIGERGLLVAQSRRRPCIEQRQCERHERAFRALRNLGARALEIIVADGIDSERQPRGAIIRAAIDNFLRQHRGGIHVAGGSRVEKRAVQQIGIVGIVLQARLIERRRIGDVVLARRQMGGEIMAVSVGCLRGRQRTDRIVGIEQRALCAGTQCQCDGKNGEGSERKGVTQAEPRYMLG